MAIKTFSCLSDLWHKVSSHLAGAILDFTHRSADLGPIYAASLGSFRNLYVYVPPGFHPDRRFPLLIWLHGFDSDEREFIERVVRSLDESIVRGDLPPLIAVGPDGSLPRRLPLPYIPGSWYINSSQGRWEDYIVQDVVGFMEDRFPLLPGRNNRVMAGWSMGGFGAYNLGMKHPETCRYLVAVCPNLNLRYSTARGWNKKFHPETIQLFDSLPRFGILGIHPLYRLPIPQQLVFRQVWGSGKGAARRMALESPYELIERYDITAQDFEMFVSYGSRDNYNLDAQADSFVYRARQLGMSIWSRKHPGGRHTLSFMSGRLPELFAALGQRMRICSPQDHPRARLMGPTT